MHNKIVQLSLTRAVRASDKAIVRSIFYSVGDMMLNLDNKAGEAFPVFSSPAELFE